MARPPDNPAPDAPPAGYALRASELAVPVKLASGRERLSAAPGLAEREQALDRREAELAARERRNRLMLWATIAGVIVAGVGTIGTWVPILQPLIADLLNHGAQVAGG
jgi:hypothetical protein